MSTGKISLAFKLEHLRDKLASTHRVAKYEYMQYYTSCKPEINKINTGSFWDIQLSKQTNRYKTSPIEQHRISLIAKEIFKLSKNNKIKLLDVGIGNALIEDRVYGSKNIEIFGVDISDYAIHKAKSKFRGIFKLGSITKLSFEKSMFDVVVSEVLEHIPPPFTFRALSEISRVLAPEGYLLLSIPVNENLKEMVTKKRINPNQHAREYTKNIIKTELRLSGFVVYGITELYAFPDNYFIKSFFIKFIRLFTNKILSKLQVNNLIIFAQKK